MPFSMPLAPTEYAQNFTVYRHDGDCYGYVRPASILRYGQQIATMHAYRIGLTDEVYARTHTAYVLAKLAVHFDRVPCVDEELTLITQPERLKRAVNKRITRIFGSDGREAGCLDSRWVLIDTEKRTILRTHPAEFTIWDADIERELPMRMTKVPLEQTEAFGTRYADYSLCDMNGHLNNTRYVDLICDALPWEVWDTAEVEDLLIFYHKEVPRGETFTLHRAQTGENTWYFTGQREGKAAFEATVTLRARRR